VDAPEGTAARPTAPQATQTSTSTVGFPLESRICLAFTSTISVMSPSFPSARVVKDEIIQIQFKPILES
jgi:hypothetical protein